MYAAVDFAHCKKNMLHIFIETEEQMSNHEQISLLIPEEVEHRINERRILREDIQKTIHHAETTGESLSMP